MEGQNRLKIQRGRVDEELSIDKVQGSVNEIYKLPYYSTEIWYKYY